MTTPTPSPFMRSKETGLIIGQNPEAASLSEILCGAAEDLWEAAALDDPAQMWEDARRAASRVLTTCAMC